MRPSEDRYDTASISLSPFRTEGSSVLQEIVPADEEEQDDTVETRSPYGGENPEIWMASPAHEDAGEEEAGNG
jgi:hypothetical protein